MTKPNKDEISKVMSELGKRSAKKLTKEQRKERSKKAAEARWGKKEDEDDETMV